jgi:hypothetical protein
MRKWHECCGCCIRKLQVAPVCVPWVPLHPNCALWKTSEFACIPVDLKPHWAMAALMWGFALVLAISDLPRVQSNHFRLLVWGRQPETTVHYQHKLVNSYVSCGDVKRLV